MTKSILNDCLLIKDQPLEKLKEYLHSINLHVFDQILSRVATSGDNTIIETESKQTVLFILLGYSEDSPMVILRQGHREEKEAICEYLGIPEYMAIKLINLNDQTIRIAVTDYLEQFSGPEFKTLMFMKIQHEDFERDITNREYSSKKEETYYYDIKEHGKAIAESLRLAKNINALEKELKSQSTYKAIDEVKEWKFKGKDKAKKPRNGSVEQLIR